ncbi:MAG TPA: ATP-binding protein [Puia sp.]|nr:ATP-binding protein [Puia sp.]
MKIPAQTPGFSVSHYNSENGLPQNSIKGIERDRIGYLWLATEMGLVRFDGSGFRVFNMANAPQLGTNRMVGLRMQGDGTIQVDAENNLVYTIDNQGTLQRGSTGASRLQVLNRGYALYDSCRNRSSRGEIPGWALPDVRSVYRSVLNSFLYVQGRYYYFNDAREFISADSTIRSFRKITFTGGLAAVMKRADRSTVPLSLLQDGNFIRVRWGGTIYRIIMSDSISARSEPLITVGDIPNITVCREWPAEHMVVVGTMADGLYIFRKHFFSTLLLRDPEANVFYAQVPYGPDGVLTKKAVLFPGRTIPVPGFTSESLLQTTGGHYYANRWLESHGSGIVEMDTGLRETRFIPENDLRVHCFRQFRDGSIWLTASNHFLGKIENDRVDWIDFPEGIPAEFSVHSFIEGDAGEIWIGGNRGLIRFNPTTRKTVYYNELSKTEIRFLYEDQRHTLWMGTYGKGLLAQYQGRLIGLPEDHNHYLSTVHCMLGDDKGFCWISTNRGLFQAAWDDLYAYLEGRISSVYYYYYDRNDGFLSNEFNGGCTPSGIRLNNGKFSLPSVRGLVQFFPDSIVPVMPDAPLHIDEIMMDTLRMTAAMSSIRVPRRVRHLQFTVSSPYFGNDYNQRIEYRLGETDSNWYTVQRDGIIEMNTLPAGSYHLQLRKKAGFGGQGYIRADLSFSVDAAFWESRVFQVLVLIALAGLFFSLARARIRYLVRRKNQLAKEVYEKTREQLLLIDSLEGTVNELEQSREELYQHNQFIGKLAMIIAHDLKSPLWFLHMATRRLNQDISSSGNAEVKGVGLELQKTSASIFHFVDDFSYWLGTMTKNFRIQRAEVFIKELLQDLQVFFTELMKARGNTWVVSFDGPVCLYTDRELLKIILRNIIDNANKNTLHGVIAIEFHAQGDQAVLTVSDSGNGMSADMLGKIHRRLREQTPLIEEKEFGYGYRFIIDFCKLLKVEIMVDSDIAKGTSVTLSGFALLQDAGTDHAFSLRDDRRVF